MIKKISVFRPNFVAFYTSSEIYKVFKWMPKVKSRLLYIVADARCKLVDVFAASEDYSIGVSMSTTYDINDKQFRELYRFLVKYVL